MSVRVRMSWISNWMDNEWIFCLYLIYLWRDGTRKVDENNTDINITLANKRRESICEAKSMPKEHLQQQLLYVASVVLLLREHTLSLIHKHIDNMYRGYEGYREKKKEKKRCKPNCMKFKLHGPKFYGYWWGAIKTCAECSRMNVFHSTLLRRIFIGIFYLVCFFSPPDFSLGFARSMNNGTVFVKVAMEIERQLVWEKILYHDSANGWAQFMHTNKRVRRLSVIIKTTPNLFSMVYECSGLLLLFFLFCFS